MGGIGSKINNYYRLSISVRGVPFAVETILLGAVHRISVEHHGFCWCNMGLLESLNAGFGEPK